MKTIKIECDGIENISTNIHSDLRVTLENPSFKFICEIDARDIILNCNSQEELLNEMDEEVIHEYLRVNGYMYNKA